MFVKFPKRTDDHWAMNVAMPRNMQLFLERKYNFEVNDFHTLLLKQIHWGPSFGFTNFLNLIAYLHVRVLISILSRLLPGCENQIFL